MLTIHSCILDSDRLMLGHGDKEIELTRMETRLIAALGKQLDDWVSERMIRSRVWNEPADDISTDGTGKIKAMVARLRRKFKKHSVPLTIVASRKCGLRLAQCSHPSHRHKEATKQR